MSHGWKRQEVVSMESRKCINSVYRRQIIAELEEEEQEEADDDDNNTQQPASTQRDEHDRCEVCLNCTCPV